MADIDPEYASRLEGKARFVRAVEDVLDNPVNTLHVLESWIGHQIMDEIGVEGHDVGAVAHHAVKYPKAIRVLGEASVFFVGYGVMTQTQTGIWLTGRTSELYYADERQSPVQVIWRDLIRRHSSNRQGIVRVADLARRQQILIPGANTQAAYRRLIDG